jgi:hypothetical protein
MENFVSSFYSALGGATAAVIIALLTFFYIKTKTALLSYSSANLLGLKVEVHPELVIFNEPQDQLGAKSTDEFQNILAIKIINQTGSPLFIASAAFKPNYLKYGFWPKVGVEVRSSYRSTRFKNALEIKFGPDNRTQYCVISEQQPAVTWVRLEQPPSANMIKSRICGRVLIKYATESKTGVHVESV